MKTGLQDSVVWITGASGGIGRALAETFAEEGAQLVLHGHRRHEELESWLSERPWRDRAIVMRADLARPDGLDEALRPALSRFGRLDAVVANAGHWHPESLPLHELAAERVLDAVAANLSSAIWTARAFMKVLARTGPRPDGQGSSLVFIGSTAGRFGERGHADYAAAKAGLIGLMLSLKNEIVRLDPFARVNTVEPGWTVTHLVRPALAQSGVIGRVNQTMALRQLGRAVDVARTVVYLCSPRLARHVSGQVVTVAGGMEGRVQWNADEVDEDAVRRRLGEE